MRSRLYNETRQECVTSAFTWTTGVMRAVFLPASYIPNFDHVYLSSIPAGTRIAVSEPITGRAAVAGVCTCNPIEFQLVSSSVIVGMAAIYRDTGVDATSRLIHFIGDEDLVTEPFVPLGLDYFIYPNIIDGGLFRV